MSPAARWTLWGWSASGPTTIPPTSRISDIAHRPFQVVTPLDVALLRRLGRAVVVTQQDLIAYHNPAYFEDYAAWHGYRELAREALGSADRVAFFSKHAAGEAVGEDLVEPSRARVVYIGVNHRVLAPSVETSRPAALADERRSCSVSGRTSCTRTASSRCAC